MTPANGDPGRQAPRSVDEALEFTYRRARRIRRRRWAPPLTGAAVVLAGLLALVLVPGPGGSEVAEVVRQASPTIQSNPAAPTSTAPPEPDPVPWTLS